MQDHSVSRRTFLKGSVAFAAIGGGVSGTAMAATAVKGPQAAWMKGFPPAPDARVRFSDGSFAKWPQVRWSINHLQELVPTASVWRGSGPARTFPRRAKDLDGLRVRVQDGRSLSFADVLEESFTDGLVVVHRGAIIFERYFAHTNEHSLHGTMSATKSFVGTLAEQLIHEGALDREALVPTVIPELADSAWANASVGQVLDMVVSMTFDEDYSNPDSEVYRYLRSAGMLPMSPGSSGPQSFYDYLPTVRPAAEHGRAFAYREPNINVLGWLVRRASGLGLADLLSTRIWQKLGAEHDAYFMQDSSGAETTMSISLRDFARFGEMIRNRGSVDGERIISPSVVSKLFAGGDRDKFALAGLPTMKSGSYRSQWWIRNVEGRNCPLARGAYGQFLMIDPASEIVIARFGSSKQSSSLLLDPIIFPTFDAITGALRES